MRDFSINRRQAFAGIGAALGVSLVPGIARADAGLDLTAFGLDGSNPGDQSEAFQAALDAAAAQGKALILPKGEFHLRGVNVPARVRLSGVPGATYLLGFGDAPILHIGGVEDVIIEAISFLGNLDRGTERGLVVLEGAANVSIRDCRFKGRATGITAFGSRAVIENCLFNEMGDAAVHSLNGNAMQVRDNRINLCGNAGIRIWRDENGIDGSIVTGNQVSSIDWVDGGNGQNGNGVNVYKADNVVVADNVFVDCSFTAVRVSSANNALVRGNSCVNSGEVAIFSEFAFSGSVIADNVIDGAATGISITNLDSGGRLATCTGNVVRNITERSAVNPDTKPVGIYAEADTVVANNAIDNVPGIGIAVGNGAFVRNVVVSDNVINDVKTGIAVSVVEDEKAGPVSISGNLIGAGTEVALAGMEWDKMVSADLVRDAAKYPRVSLSGNVAG